MPDYKIVDARRAVAKASGDVEERRDVATDVEEGGQR